MRIGRTQSTCRSPSRPPLVRADERLLSRIAGSRMWFAAQTRQAMAYRIQTDPCAAEVNRSNPRPPDVSLGPLADPLSDVEARAGNAHRIVWCRCGNAGSVSEPAFAW